MISYVCSTSSELDPVSVIISQARKHMSKCDAVENSVCGPCLVVSVKKLSHWLNDVTLAKLFHCFE